ncbi:hypothetical protein JW906_11795, partial [bacterium]|nr:hypothetical protein [bacterium]
MASRNRISGDALHIPAFFILSALCVIGWAAERDIPAASMGTLQFYVDHADFLDVEGDPCEEFYLMLYADQLETLPDGGRRR